MKLRELISKLLRRPSLYEQAVKAGVKIGGGNIIYTKFWSTEPYLITIGNNCQITAGVTFLTHGGAHVLRNEIPDFDTFGKIKIGNNVYIGTRSLILPGVTIDDNVIVAAGSVVTKSVPTNVVIGGNPARILCTIEEYKEKNLKYNTSTKGLKGNEKRKVLCSLGEEMFVQKKYMQYK